MECLGSDLREKSIDASEECSRQHLAEQGDFTSEDAEKMEMAGKGKQKEAAALSSSNHQQTTGQYDVLSPVPAQGTFHRSAA
jgi:hypothetical protein